MALKILFVDNSTRCFYIFRLAIARACKQLGYEVYVMTPSCDEYSSKIEKEGIRHISYSLKSKFSPIEDVKILFFFIKQYGKIKPDYVIHYTIKPNIYGSIAARMHNIKSLAVVPGTGSVFSKKKSPVSLITTFLYKIAFKYPQKVWVLNNEDKVELIKRKILQENRIEILPGEGVDVEYFKLNKKYRKGDPFIFLYIGRMLKEKGLRYLVQAIEILKKETDYKFQVCLLGLVDGLSQDIITLDEIRAWEQKGLVKYLGSMSDVRPTIEMSDCVILPSYYGEGMPRSLMEASAMQRVIITTDNVGCRDVVIDGETGFLCQAKDAQDLADKMRHVISLSEQELQKLGVNGRNKVLRDFDDKIIIKKYIDLIQS